MKKYEREIRDLLESMDSFVPDGPAQEKERTREREPEREVRRTRPVGVMPPQPIPIRPRRSFFARLGQWLTEHHVGLSLRLMLSGLGLVIIALIIRQNFGNSVVWLAQIIGAVGALVFIAPVLVRFFKGRDLDNSNDPQYWRGQAVESEHFSWGSLKKWLGGGNRRKGKNNPWEDRNRRGKF